MVEVYLVRHGETDWNKNNLCQGHKDNPLNDYGRECAHNLGRKMKEQNLHFDVFMCSPLIRTKETLEIIKEELGKESEPTILNPAFIERDFGDLEGETTFFVREVISRNEATNYRGYESDEHLEKRVYLGMLDLQKYQEKKILIICHAHSIKGLITYLEPSKYSFKTPLDNLNVSRFEVEDNRVKLRDLHYL